MSAFRTLAVTIFAMQLMLPFVASAKNGAFRSTKHGDAVKGPMRKSTAGRGSCAQCHSGHASHEATGGSRGQLGLFAPNDNNFCFVCHALPSEDGIFPGSGAWSQSTHATSSQVVGGGSDPQRNAEPNRCVNCHDPHGVKDQKGVIPAMMASREPELCLGCHDGSRGADIRSEMLASWSHGAGARGTHDPHEGEEPQMQGGFSSANRHVSCSDCHNVHRASRDRMPPAAPEASARLSGVSRVRVNNGPAGTQPTFTYLPAHDPGVANEYEICFKCHSSYAKQPPQQTDVALVTNPANPSYHPIQAQGKNRGIRPDAFTGEWSAESLVRCTDCHGSDSERVAGPHGSRHQYLLKREAITSAGPQAVRPDNLCFGCHAFAVYADPASDALTLAASRFNSPSSAGHAFHVGLQRVPCWSCHETHGSTRNPALIANGREHEILSYTQTPNGGTCNASCHAQQTYTVNYGR